MTEQRVSLATVAGRNAVPFRMHPHAAELLSKATGFASADLVFRAGKFRLHAVVTMPTPAVPRSAQVVGVDLGLNRPAVLSNNQFLGQRRWREIDRRYFRLRRSLQGKGTKSARRHLRRLRGKVNRFRRDCDHVLSRRIVQAVVPGSTIVVENLVHLRNRVKQRGRASRRRLHSWPFAQLRGFLSYKTEEIGCAVVGIDPRHTSQRCSRCGHTERANRKSQARFVCRSCGFELNADLNASRNIAAKYHAGGGKPAAGGLPVNQPLVSVGHSAPPDASCRL